jgi:hypothetical protein
MHRRGSLRLVTGCLVKSGEGDKEMIDNQDVTNYVPICLCRKLAKMEILATSRKSPAS